jgi:hypothetical protein
MLDFHRNDPYKAVWRDVAIHPFIKRVDNRG